MTDEQRKLLEQIQKHMSSGNDDPGVFVRKQAPEAFEAALVEIDRLREIVDQLPKTVDGVPMAPGKKYYYDYCYRIAHESVQLCDMDGSRISGNSWHSTREAAEKSREG